MYRCFHSASMIIEATVYINPDRWIVTINKKNKLRPNSKVGSKIKFFPQLMHFRLDFCWNAFPQALLGLWKLPCAVYCANKKCTWCCETHELNVNYLWQRLDALSSHLNDGLRGAGSGGADVFDYQSWGEQMITFSYRMKQQNETTASLEN